jgi:hypothetical protein
MLTTIQIHKDVKNQLHNFRTKTTRTYEQVIVNLIDIAKKNKAKDEELLKQGYSEMAKDASSINDEYFSADEDW